MKSFRQVTLVSFDQADSMIDLLGFDPVVINGKHILLLNPGQIISIDNVFI